jgi:hypothetical protein
VTYITAFVPALCACDAGRHERSDNPSQANERNKADILADNPTSSSRSEKYSPQSMTEVGGHVVANDVL